MSAVEMPAQVESFEHVRSRVKLTRNAKGQAQWEVSVAVGDALDALDQARQIAVAQWRALEAEFGGAE